MSTEEQQDIKLNQQWSVKFMVKMREKQGQYRHSDFIGNFIDIGQQSNSLLEIFKNIRTVPDYDARQRGILSIFRNNISPVYEDPENANGFYIRIIITKDQEHLNKQLEELKQQQQQQQSDQRKYADQVKRKLAPIMNPCDDILMNFIFMGLSGVLSPSEGMFNGIYTHIEDGTTKIDFWYNKKAKEKCKDQVLQQFKILLSEINEQFTCEDPNGKKYTLLDTLQAIDMIDYKANKKQKNK